MIIKLDKLNHIPIFYVREMVNRQTNFIRPLNFTQTTENEDMN